MIALRRCLETISKFTAVTLALAVTAGMFHTDIAAAPAWTPNDNIPIYRVNTNGNQIALTFDAAWGSNMTGAMLDIFDKYGVKVTFFVTGRWAELNADELRTIAGRGHEIGSHGFRHLDYVKLNADEMINDLTLASEAFERVIGIKPTIFRAPYGSWNAKVVDIVCGQQFDFIQWDVDSLDWKGLLPGAMEERVLPIVKSGSILLFHNDGRHTREVLPSIIEQLQARGFTFVTVTELVGEGLEAAASEPGSAPWALPPEFPRS